MTTIVEALRSLVIGDEDILADITSGGREGKPGWHPLPLPQGVVVPAFSYLEVSAVRPHASPQGPLRQATTRFQIDAWASTYESALALAEKLRKRIDGYRGNSQGVVIQSIFIDGSRVFYESEPKQYRVSRDYLISHEEQIASG